MWLNADGYNAMKAKDFEDQPDPLQPARDAIQFARDTADQWQPAKWASDAADFARSTVAGLGGQPEPQPEHAQPSAIPTTAAISNPTQYVGSPSVTLDDIYRIAKGQGLDDEGARVAAAIAQTEGGLAGAAGDSGKSRGPFQFYGDANRPGQLNNYANQLGMSIQQAGEYVSQHPADAATWALRAGGYLGDAIRRGTQKGLAGAELATYAQNPGKYHDWGDPGGQVSVSPERAGQNYDALYGGGAGPVGTGPTGTPASNRQPVVWQTGGSPDSAPQVAPDTRPDFQKAWENGPGGRFLGSVGRTVGDAMGQAGEAIAAAPYAFPVAGYTGKDVPLHWGSNAGGTDLFAAEGTPVVAMRGGKVISSSTDSIGGNAVLIQGDDGNQYYYAHLYQTPAVKAGQAVVAGDYLGGVGDTGNAKGTGAHLHMGIGPSIVNGSGPQGGTGGDFNAVGLLQNTLAQAGKGAGDFLSSLGEAQGQALGNIGQTVGDTLGAHGEAIGNIAEAVGGTVGAGFGKLGEGLQAANEAVAPYTFTRLGRESAGFAQMGNENRAGYDRLAELLPRLDAGDTSVLPEMTALTNALNEKQKGDLLDTAKRNPDLWKYDTMTGLVQGAAATVLAPSLAAGPVRNVIAGAIDPLGQAMNVAPGLVAKGAKAFNAGEMGAIRVPGGKVPRPSMPPIGSDAAPISLMGELEGYRSAGGMWYTRNSNPNAGDFAKQWHTSTDPQFTAQIEEFVGKVPEAPPAAKSAAEAELQKSFVGGARDNLQTGAITPEVLTSGNPKMAAAMGEPPDFAGNIRLSKYEPDIQQIVLDAHAAGAGALDTTRRGVMSASELKSLADQVGTSAGAIVKTWQPGDAANAETLYALRQTLAGQSKRLLDAQKVYGTVDSTENLAALTEELARQKTIQDVVAGVTSEAGRGLWQFTRKIEGTDAATRIQQFIKFTGNRFTPEELGGVMKGVNFEDPIAVAKTTRELFVPTIKDKLTTLWYFNLLSSPTTHIKNTVSNAVTLAGKPIEAAIAAPIDVARAGIGRALGKEVQRERFVGEAPANVAGMLASVQEGALSALQIMRYGYTKSEAAAKIDIGMREAFTGPVGAVVNIPGRSLRASDVFFRSMNKTAEIYGQAFRIAKQEGKTGQAFTNRVVELRTNPLPEMVKAAEKEGAYRVFQQDGRFINWATSGRNKVGGGAIRLVVPFIQTPYNITKYILERSPLGYAGVAVDAAAGKIASGGNLSDRLARASMGSAIFASIYADAAAGNITGAAPTGAEGDAFYRQGKQPYSFKVGGKWYSYQALQPFSTLFAAAAAVSKAADKGQDQNAIAAAAQVSMAMGRSLTDMPWTQGLADALEAYQDPDRFAAAYANKFVTGLTPGAAFWRWVARSTDQTLRDPNNPVESVMANLPGLSANVPARLDAMGQPVKRSVEQTGFGALNTFNPSPEDTDPVEMELARLQAKGLKVQPSFVSTNMTLGKETVPLKRDEIYEYQRVSGQLAYGFLLANIGTPQWNALSDKDKAKEIDIVFNGARELQRALMQPQVLPRADQQWYDRIVKETGAPPNLAPAAPTAPRAPIVGARP